MSMVQPSAGGPARAGTRAQRKLSARANTEVETRLTALAALDLKALRWAWRDTYGTEAPAGLGREFLLRCLAHRIQTHAFGDLDAKIKRLFERLAGGDASVIAAPVGVGLNLKPGSFLVREYKGEVHRVTVMEEGFAWQGKTYPTLSAVARVITGASWNGFVFFGLRKNTASTPEPADG